MKDIAPLIRRKSQLLHDIELIKKYIDTIEYDRNLKDVFDEHVRELKEITEQLNALICRPEYEEYEKKKMQLLAKIRYHEKEIAKYQKEIDSLNEMISRLNQ